MLEKFWGMIKSPLLWVVCAGLYAVIYFLFTHRKKGDMAYIGIGNVFKNYRRVFTHTRHYLFFLIFPFLIAIATNLNTVIKKDIADTICVVLSILTAMVLTFMAMTNEKYINSSEKGENTLTSHRQKVRNEEAIAVGMHEIVVSIAVLILTFLFPIFSEQKIICWLISFLIYYGFYIFLLNILIMVRRLYQVYFPPKAS